MRSFGFCVSLLLVGTALVCLITTITSSLPDTDFNIHKKDTTLTATSRKMKNIGYTSKTSDNHHYNLEDYGHNDPVPASKAYIRHGTIQHGSPLMPYIPKPSSPSAPPAPGRAKRDGLP
ncbi:uncharacterized protein LOC141717361 [Apium graveolens]|uniref:uncharacterized protein LOC141717361 n=1 Tax=Apium graveolens TaxID=4045 RepID=UPI003D7A1561